MSVPEVISAAQPRVDLDNCAGEPIHIPGSIQSHGVLLAANPQDLRIVQWSANAIEWLELQEAHIRDRSVAEFVDDQTVARLERLVGKSLPGMITPLMTTLRGAAEERDVKHDAHRGKQSCKACSGGGFYLGTAHVNDGVLLMEFENRLTEQIQLHSSVEEGTESITRCVQRATSRLHAAGSQQELYHGLADEIRHLTGYDRVMVYRFMPDLHGVVEGEALREGLESYLGLHYPASDIPDQARRLYTLNLIRVIADVNAAAVPLRPSECPLTQRPLDLTYSSFRSVSPIHIEYLRNMGVAASMSISILNGGQLWGLIACHNYQPRNVSLEIRAACELLGSLAGSYVVTRQISDEVHIQNDRQHQLSQALQEMAGKPSIEIGLGHVASSLRQVVDAQGVAVCWRNGIQIDGVTPSEQLIVQLRNHFATELRPGVWSSSSLPSELKSLDFPSEVQEQLIETASGALVLQLGTDPSDQLIFFRPQYVTEVNWGGNPAKDAHVAEAGIRLSPRKSFAQWTQTVQFQSRPWSRVDQVVAMEMHAGLLQLLAQRSAELIRVNEELLRANADLDSFAYAASHDLKEPLRTINQTVFFLERALSENKADEVRRRAATIQRTTQRMTDLLEGLLRVSRAGSSDLHREPTSLADVVKDAAEISLAHTPDEVELVVHPLPTVVADFMCLRDVFQNLFSNARKYSTAQRKRIEVGCVDLADLPAPSTQAIGSTAIYVKDNGIGIASDRLRDVFQVFRRLHLSHEYEGGSGVGLAIVKRIVERHGGVVWATSEAGQGSTFYFTLEGIQHVY